MTRSKPLVLRVHRVLGARTLLARMRLGQKPGRTGRRSASGSFVPFTNNGGCFTDMPVQIKIASKMELRRRAHWRQIEKSPGIPADPLRIKATKSGGCIPEQARMGPNPSETAVSQVRQFLRGFNGSFRRCRRLFCLLQGPSSKMLSNFEAFCFAPNFDARVRSTAFLHR
jgi:hypothetical protein